MVVDPRLFPLTAHLKEGDRVHFRRMGATNISIRGCGEGTGIIELIWLGIEETVDIRCDDGKFVRCCPVLDAICLM